MSLVHDEVTRLRRDLGLGGRPGFGRGDEFQPVELHGEVHDRRCGVPGGAASPLRAGVLAVTEHGAECQGGTPVEPGYRRHGSEDPITRFPRHGCPFRGLGTDQDGNVDGTGRSEPRPVQHLDDRAVPVRSLSPQQRPEHPDVVGDVRPRARSSPQADPTGEPGPDPDRDARLPSQRDEGSDACGVDHRVAKGGDQHARAEADTLGQFRGSAELHPPVGGYTAGES